MTFIQSGDREWSLLRSPWCRPAKGDDDLRDRLFRTVGYSLERNQTFGSGPLAVAPIAELETIVATVLYQAGISWDEAVTRWQPSISLERMVAPPAADEIRARANLVSLLRTFRDAEIRLAVATTDNRLAAENCLEVSA